MILVGATQKLGITIFREVNMICEECKKCENYEVCENGCFGSTDPCEHLLVISNDGNGDPCPNYWGEY